jgi:cytidine deaminase
MCAERVAMFKAVSEGEKEFEAMAIATVNGGKPCGSCRQVMAEFNLSMIVLIVDESGKLYLESTVAQLLPEAFTPKDLI